MKAFNLILIFLIIACSSFGQVAVIKDKNGYTNVRHEANGESEVIYKILDNEVFWFDYEVGYFENEWVEVFIPKNKFSFSSSDPDYIRGFVHKSRILPIDKLPKLTTEDLKFKYELSSFDSTGKIIDRQDNKWITQINGRPVWGTDGDFPKLQVEIIKVSIDNNEIFIHPVFYCDIYECDGGYTIYKNGETYFVYQMNSDGAGAYQIVWVFTKKNGLIQRLVGTMI
jgi:hypothetical protein